MLGVSAIGSVTDLAVLLLVSADMIRRARLGADTRAAVVATAEQVEGALDDRMQADLDVEDRDIEAYKRG